MGAAARLRQALAAGAASILCAFAPPALGAAETACVVAPFEPAEAQVAIPPGVRIGVAFGSGSMHGLAHIGVVQELEALGVPVPVVAGTSVGALVGGLWASGVGGKRLERLSREPAFQDFGSFAGSWQGLFSSEGLRDVLEREFGQRPIEAWPRRFGAVATSIATGERRILATGDGAVAIQASSAVPILFHPIEVRGERLVDGALVEPVPVDAARDLGANFVIGVDVAYRPHEGEASGMAQYAFQSMHVMVNALSASQLRSADAVIRLNLHHTFMECGREALIAAGRDAVRRAWPEIQRSLALRTAEAK